MKVSLYSTVLNEESSIRDFLDSSLQQSRPPDEIIIVDGGSKDGTIDIINDYIENGAPIRLIVKKGANVAEGRNEAIRNAQYEIVASTDAGCRLDKDWLRNLVAKFDEKVDIVSGVYLPDPHHTFESCVAELTYPKVDSLPPDWSFPSHRSIAFRKEVWRSLGGFPENLYRSEDTWFDIEAKRRGFKFRLARDAIVYWRPRQNLRDLFRNAYLWTKSDIENRVNEEAVTRDAISDIRRITWKILGVSILFFVGIYLSWVAALLLFPFVLKNMIRRYSKRERIIETVLKNVIGGTYALARSLGFIAGKIASRRKKG